MLLNYNPPLTPLYKSTKAIKVFTRPTQKGTMTTYHNALFERRYLNFVFLRRTTLYD